MLRALPWVMPLVVNVGPKGFTEEVEVWISALRKNVCQRGMVWQCRGLEVRCGVALVEVFVLLGEAHTYYLHLDRSKTIHFIYRRAARKAAELPEECINLLIFGWQELFGVYAAGVDFAREGWQP
jgi:hypothetical protein